MTVPNINFIEKVIKEDGTKEAISLIEKELIKYPDHSDLLYYKGVCISSFDNFEDATDYFNKSMQLNSSNTKKCLIGISAVYCKGANVLFHEKKFDTAQLLFEKSLAFDNNSNGALLGLANILFKKEDYKGAKEFLERSISLNDNHSLSYYMLGACCHKLLDYKNSELNYLQALRISPNFLNTYIWISNLYIDMNENDKALTYLRKAEMISPGDLSLKTLIVGIMFKLDLFEDIIKFLDANFTDDLIKPSFYYSLRSFIRDINVIDFNDDYLNKPFNFISKNNTFVNDGNFNAISNKIIDLSSDSKIIGPAKLSSIFFNFKKESIIHDYFSKHLEGYVDNHFNNDLFFSNFNYESDIRMRVHKSKNSFTVDESPSGYAKVKALLFFINDDSDVYTNLEVEFSYNQLTKSSYFNKSFIKKISINEHSLLFFPGFINFKILNKNKIDLTFCTIDFNNS